MYKLIVSDFDGTLVDDDLAIPFSTMLEIDRVRRKKVLFAIATSRCLGDVLYYNRDFSFLDYVIATNGSLVYDVNKEKILFKKSVSTLCIKKIYKTFKDYDIYACRKDRKFKLLGLDDIKDIYKLEIVCSSEDDSKKIIKILSELDLAISYSRGYVNNNHYVDIVSTGINKFVGIEKVCTKKKINTSEVLAFGDYFDDIEMIKNVGEGVALDNAIKEVKDVCGDTTLSNLNKGVEEFIKNKF